MGLYRDNGKESGSYYSGFRIYFGLGVWVFGLGLGTWGRIHGEGFGVKGLL